VRVRVEAEAAEAVRRLPTPLKAKLKKAMAGLARDPFGHEGTPGIRKLRSKSGAVFRLRVGAWRIVYLVDRNEVRVVRVFPREDGYGWMDRLGF
jgi:mRNA-degrading endonuclease RelE of RelBE toxin-antitoxin system